MVAMENIPGRGLYASGQLFWDDGDSIDTYENGMYLSMYFECFKNRLDIRVQYDNITNGNKLMVDSIEILGVENWMNYVHVNGKEHNRFTNHQAYKKLLIEHIGLDLAQNSVIEWSRKREGTQEEYDRIDCLPDANKYTDERTECTRRNCIWRPVNDVDGIPVCFIDNSQYGYNNVNLTSTVGTETLYHLQWRNQSQMFTGDIFNVTLAVDYINNNLIRLKLFDPSSSRYEVPVSLNFERATVNNPKYKFIYEIDYLNRVSFKINRRSTNTTIFDTSIGGLTFADQFLQLVTRVPSKDLYGFGENRHFSLRHDFNYTRWPMFSRDQAPGWGDYGNLYGVHPFHSCIEDDQGNTHGILLLNSNAMEIGFQPSPAITYRTIGGVLDFYIFLGPEPESVIQQYTNMIGRPYLPPYWSLGFQLCRYGYNSLQTMKEAVDRTIAADIPFDVQYADIDHMDERMDFTIDETNFDDLSKFVRDLQDRGMRFIIILDPAIISNVTNYRPYELGLEKNIYIKWPTGMNPDYDEYQNDNVLGYVWPKGKTVFPDFLNPNSSSYWSELIVDHFNEIPYDGLWIDMNEPANFGTNEERPFNWPEKDKPYWSLKCPTNKWDDPPYKPISVYGPRLSEKTVCMVSLQNNGVYRHYDVHSLYGWSQTEPTLRALQTASGKRGMVISRSTYPGSGQYAGHWLGDNDSSWKHLYDSIIGIIEFNLFGIPYIGADICGFFGDSSPELCERWMQLGAFYTYNRNHNGLNNKPQDPAAFGAEVASSSRKALRIRYSLLPYLYTLFFNVNQRGGTVIRGLFHEFPTDEVARKIETQFLWGSSFMVAPVYLPGVSRREVYFPGRSTIWYDYYTGSTIKSRGGYETVPAPRDTIPLFIRGGSILPTQRPANTTMSSRLNPFKLIVAPGDNGMASGTLFWDDGEGIGNVENGQYFTAEFTSTTTTVTMAVTKQHNVVNVLEIHSIIVFNIPSKPLATELAISGANSSNTNIQYNSFHKVLKLSGFKIPLSNNFTLSWILP
ncbi:hypothetical protein LOTGIDRAFT_227855 [Lottia gigantea]|uniref:P-type domain-containing protein n=1 Tax=Lottia gigantea TaxID=225164 RepID=V4CRM8_LOTGI|nr:hypothetical protein LOTGIDRAFT_227855 [Lottia gigantea]ESP05175.1 hypothetical protein LOTGIDRAFT_227855 [Lottia gigantea]